MLGVSIESIAMTVPEPASVGMAVAKAVVPKLVLLDAGGFDIAESVMPGDDRS